MIDLQDVKIKHSSSWNKICPFPIGFIYQSTDSTSPSSTFGGQWTRLDDSKFLRPGSGWNSQGGQTYFDLTLPFLRTISDEVGTSTGSALGLASSYSTSISAGGRAVVAPSSSISGQVRTIETMPPYRTCYAWYRTA